MAYDSAQAIYRDLADSFPQSAEAFHGLGMTYRYISRLDSAMVNARRALELDSEAVGVLLNYADLNQPLRTGTLAALPDVSDSARYAESERCNLKAAASDHPFNAHANLQLWSGYMARGRLSDARHQASELWRKRYYPQPVLDFGYNLLVGLAPNAILLTQGDNATNPLWTLQNGRERFRPDVLVVNVPLLNITAVVKMLKDSLGLPVSFTSEEIDSLKPRKGENHVELVSEQVVTNVIANAATAGRPVYFAVTLRNIISDLYADRTVREGLVSRVMEETAAAPVDYDRIAENLTKKYRLRWPKRLPSWPQNMSPTTRSIAPLAVNYANLYVLLASRGDSLARKDEAAAAWHQAVDWMVRGERKDVADAFVEEWLKRSPDEPVARQLKAKLAKIRGPQAMPDSQ
jgi:tetratricopeptide (TPR) repeat protein